eukprot:6212052-Pleurochrysis_carterae.AAC.1
MYLTTRRGLMSHRIYLLQAGTDCYIDFVNREYRVSDQSAAQAHRKASCLRIALLLLSRWVHFCKSIACGDAVHGGGENDDRAYRLDTPHRAVPAPPRRCSSLLQQGQQLLRGMRTLQPSSCAAPSRASLKPKTHAPRPARPHGTAYSRAACQVHSHAHVCPKPNSSHVRQY